MYLVIHILIPFLLRKCSLDCYTNKQGNCHGSWPEDSCTIMAKWHLIGLFIDILIKKFKWIEKQQSMHFPYQFGRCICFILRKNVFHIENNDCMFTGFVSLMIICAIFCLKLFCTWISPVGMNLNKSIGVIQWFETENGRVTENREEWNQNTALPYLISRLHFSKWPCSCSVEQ